uniref:Uncharacterized protein n=1 Tax=Arundo donax TaxID=35708 RepID=A0A0A8YA65_ARUDO
MASAYQDWLASSVPRHYP